MKKIKLILGLFVLLLFSGCSDTNYYSSVFSFPGLFSDSGELVVIQDSHYMNHLGAFWTASFAPTLNSAQSVEFTMCLNATTEFHFTDLSMAVSGSPVNFYLYDSPTITNNGTQFNMTNMNREFRNTVPGFDTYQAPTYTSAGTLLFQDAVTGSTGQGAKINAPFRLASEWILTDGCFLFVITNNDGNNNDLYINFYGYEE